MHRTVSPAAPAAFRRQPVGPLQLAVLILLSAGSGGAYAQAAASGAAATQTGTTQAGTATQTGTTQAGTTAADTALPAVSVSASATPDSPLHLNQPVAGGALGSRSQLDTPFSTTVVTGEELADRQVAKLGDVFAGDASVSDNSGAYSAWASYLTVRGLQLDWQTGYRIDGMPFVAYGITMPYEQLERVELLKGLSGFMYGFGAPGGVVNYVTKKPGQDPVTSFDVGYRMDGVFTEHADISRRFGPDGMFGARVNATHEEGKTYNAGNINRNTFSAALDGQLTRDLSVDLGVLYQERRTSGQTPSIYTGLYTGSSLPSPISGGTNNLGGTDQFLNTNLQLYTAGVHYQLTPDWTLSSTYSYSKVSRQRNESTLYLLDSAGDYSDSRWDGNESQTYQQWQGMAEGKVKTGPFTHQLVLGASWQRETADYEANSSYISLGNGNLYAPNPYRYYRSGGLLDYRANDITEKALFASDTIQLTSRWSVLGGVRYTNYEQNAYTVSGQTASTYSQSGIVTPTVALMYKLEPNTTLYASYVESLEPGQRVDDVYANGGELLRPLRSRQYELGVKSEHARWSANAAVFRIERGATYVTDNVFKEDGDSIFEGIEAGASAKLGSQWRVAGDVMLLDSWYAKGQSYEGNRVAGAPTFVAAGSVTYAVPYVPGLQVGVNAKFTGNTELRAAGNLQTGGYLLVNLGANYMTQIGGHDVTFRAALDNITNRRYWEFQYADYVKPGDPRSVSLNAKIDF